MILFAGYDPYFEGHEPDTKVIVSIKDVVDEMDVPSDEHSAFLNRHSGELVTLSSEELSAAEEGELEKIAIEWLEANQILYTKDYG